MTREELYTIKQTVGAQCTKLLESARKAKILLHKPYLREVSVYSYKVGKEPSKVILDGLREFMVEHKDLEITMMARTKASGRYDYFENVEFIAKKYKLVGEVPEYYIKELTKSIVLKQMKIESWQSLDCKIMSMFKAGKITWDEAVALHKEDCEL